MSEREKLSDNENNIEKLHKFVREKYLDKMFTVEELAYIWYGKDIFEKEEVDNIQKIVIETPYFESDVRRLFLFKARNIEDVKEDLKPKELKQNELGEFVEKYFNEYNYKKASYMLGQKKVILNFDFPRAIDTSINKKMVEFEEETNWSIEINEQTNINAAEVVIRQLFKDGDIKKISYHHGENMVLVTLNSDYKITGEIEEFKNETGLKLQIKGQNIEENVLNKNDESYFQVNKEKEKLEQNKTFEIIEQKFYYEEFKPYKKGIKTNSNGKYIELSFISPIIGAKYKNKIEELAEETGWSFAIGKSVNQNEIINLAVRLCNEANVSLKKNPSFNPSTLEVTLKTSNEIDENEFKKIKDEFDYKTGCRIQQA